MTTAAEGYASFDEATGALLRLHQALLARPVSEGVAFFATVGVADACDALLRAAIRLEARARTVGLLAADDPCEAVQEVAERQIVQTTREVVATAETVARELVTLREAERRGPYTYNSLRAMVQSRKIGTHGKRGVESLVDWAEVQAYNLRAATAPARRTFRPKPVRLVKDQVTVAAKTLRAKDAAFDLGRWRPGD